MKKKKKRLQVQLKLPYFLAGNCFKLINLKTLISLLSDFDKLNSITCK